MSVTFLDQTEPVMNEVEKQLQRALTGGIIILEGAIVDQAPVVTGKLKGSQTHEVREKEAETYNNVEYAPRIIYGFKGTDVAGRTFHQAPNNYFERGAKSAQPQVTAVVKHYLGQDIKVTGGKEKKI